MQQKAFFANDRAKAVMDHAEGKQKIGEFAEEIILDYRYDAFLFLGDFGKVYKRNSFALKTKKNQKNDKM